MEWDDLKKGMIIRWKPYFAKDYDPIIILIENKYLDRQYYESFNTQVLSGLSYNVFDYRYLLTSLNSSMGYTRIYKYNFEKNKHQITISESNDLIFIKQRMNDHIASYKIQYDTQKIWAEDLLKRAEKFYHECK